MRKFHCLLVAAPLLLAASEPPVDDPLSDIAPLSDATLADQRGGFSWQGMEIAFGADIRSFVNDELAMRTVISWTPEGSTIDQFVAPSLTPADATQIRGGILTSAGIQMKVGNETVFLANDGQTAFIQNANALQNILINTASNVSLTQQVDATIDISGYDGFRDALTMTRLSDAIGTAVAAGTLGALGN